MNRCLSAHHFSIFHEARPYHDDLRRNDPGNKTVKHSEEIYTVRGEAAPFTRAAGIDEFATARDAQTFAAYWRRLLQTPYFPFRGVHASRLAGSTGPLAWVRDSIPWAPTKSVVACIREHS